MFELSVRISAASGASAPPGASAGGCAFERLHAGNARQAFDGASGSVRVIGFGRIDEFAGEGSVKPARHDLVVESVARLWRAHGAACLDHLAGEFALVICDQATGAFVAGVDRFNTFPLYHATHGGRTAIASSPAAVAAALDLPQDLDPAAILAYCYYHVIPAPLSILRGVSRLDIGGRLQGRAGGAPQVAYWSPRFDEREPFEFEREKRRFLDAVSEGVGACAEGVDADRVGCFLSGGTDSSTLAGMLTRRLGTGARTFSIAFGVDQYDESYYSRLAAKHFGTRHTEHVLTPDDAVRAVAQVARRYEQPFGNSSAVPTLVCAEIAAGMGIDRLLGGDGGDELYGGNERYAKQWVFGLYGKAPGALRVPLEGALSILPSGRPGSLLSKARGYVDQANIPLPDRLQAKYNLLDRLGRNEVLTASFLAHCNGFQPEAMAREVWSRCDAPSQINRLLALDFKFTLGDNDLPKVTRMCHAAGVEVAFPMLTEGLVRHSLRLRPDQKLRRTHLRFFFRNALRGFLPDEIIDKQKHGFGMPFGDWLITRPELQAMADDALGSLAGRGIIQSGFVALLRKEVRAGHAGYYGTMVWILMILELWLREHMPSARM